MLKLTLAAKAPVIAYPALIAASVINKEEPESPIDFAVVDAVDVKGANAVLAAKTDILGTNDILKYFSDNFSEICTKWESWKDSVAVLSGKNFKEIAPQLETLESYLNWRTYLEGYSITSADLYVWGTLRANGVVGATIKSGTYINVTRWYSHLEQVFGPIVTKFASDVLEVRKSAKQGTKKESKASFDIDLIDAVDGQVVTRFPPEPSGYLHIGHAKAAILNQYFAQMYHGRLLIRFDDTNPSKEKVEFTNAIIEDLALLGIKGDKISHSSDYFQEMYDLAVQMIKDGNAYCDDTPLETMREQRGEGIKSARRDRTVEENLHIFCEEMLNGTEEGLKNCVRAKISVDAPNKTLRDPVVYRCNLTPHHRTGDKWKVYPTYDFCCPVLDAMEGVTHALRTIEYRDRNAQYAWMLKALKLRKVHIWDFARVNFVRTLLSKRKLQWFVDNGRVEGWDDPRFPTVRGVRRRGMTVEGLRNFIISQGPSKNIINLDWSLIWAINKKVIDPIVPRFTAVSDPVKVVLSGAPTEPTKETRPKHKKNADLGDKPVIFSSTILLDGEDAETLKDGEEFTLMDWGNAIVEKIHQSGGKITQIDAKLHLDGDFRKTEKKLHWLADSKENTPVTLVNFDHLITKDKIEEGDNFEDYLTDKTVFETPAIADLNVRNLKEGDIFQFERKGYFRVDKPYVEGSPAVIFAVPDGKVISRYGAKK